jgi:hypothetical protein
LDATGAVVVVNLLVLQQWHFSLRHLLCSLSLSLYKRSAGKEQRLRDRDGARESEREREEEK